MLNVIITLMVLLQVFLFSFTNNCFAKEQLSFNVSANIVTADLRLKIGENVIIPDITIKIGKDVVLEDFTVGVTSDKSQADFIITNSIMANYNIMAGPNVMVPDLTIKTGPYVIIPDVTIKIKTSGMVNWIVYTEKEFMNLNDLIVGLLPIINLKTNYKHEILNGLFKK